MNPQGHQRTDATHERRDADVMSLALLALLLLFGIGLCLLVAWGALRILNRERDASDPARPVVAEEGTKFPAPRNLVQPGAELAQTKSKSSAKLDSYGWTDRPGGIARIPVRQAMQLLVERGLPAVGAGQTQLQLMQARPQTDTRPNEPIPTATPETTP